MIKGKNICLRLVAEKDLDYLYQVTSDTSNNGPYWPLMLEPRKSFEDRFYKSGFWSENAGKMLIENLEGEIVGEMNFFKGLWYMPGYEVGYRIYQPQDHGKGYASEALKLFVDYLFKAKPIERLELEAAVDNLASIRIAEKVGFVKEGTKRKGAYVNGHYRDLVLMSLLKEEVFSD